METAITKRTASNNIETLELTLLRPIRSNAKLTIPKKKKFLEIYSQTANKSKAALKVGVTLDAITKLIDRDEGFKRAIQEIDQHFGQAIEAVSINLAIEPTREGLGDRKLQLQRIYPEKYNTGNNTTVNVQVVNNHTAATELRQVLDDNAVYVDQND